MKKKAAFILGTVNRDALREASTICERDFGHLEKIRKAADLDAQIFFAVEDPEHHGSKRLPMKQIRAERPRLIGALQEYAPDLVIAFGTPPCKSLFNKGSGIASSNLRLVAHDIEDVPAPVWVTWSLDECQFKQGLIRWVQMDIHAAITGKSVMNVGEYHVRTDIHPELLLWLQDVEYDGVDNPCVGLDLETAPAFNPWHPEARIRMAVISHRPDFAQVVQASPDSRFPQWLVDVIEDPTIRKVGSNIAFDARWLARFGIIMRNFADTSIAEHVIDENSPSTGLKFLALQYTGLGDYSAAERRLAAERGGMEFVADDEMYEYCAGDGKASKTIYDKQINIIDSKKLRGPYELLTRTNENLVKIEMAGACVDMSENERLDKAYMVELSELREKIRASLGPINPNSHQQLLEALQKRGVDLETQKSKRTKANLRRFANAMDELDDFKEEYSTEKNVLLREAIKHPFVQDVLDYRRRNKLHSTYVKRFRDHVQMLGGQHFVRSDYRLDRTVTYRSASRNPNLQNIPRTSDKQDKRNQLPRELDLKRQFVSRWRDIGGQIAEYDLSQAELREGAMISGEPTLVDAFLNNRDVHQKVAATLFGLDFDDVSKGQRQAGKTLNFGIFFGMGPSKLALDLTSLGYPTKTYEAKQLISDYYASLPVLGQWMQDIKWLARRDLEITTRFGFKRRFEAPDHWNSPMAWRIERQAVNTPIQNGAACFTYCGINNVSAAREKLGLRSLIILTVHDCIVWDVYPGEADIVHEISMDAMGNPRSEEWGVELTVPLVVDAEIGTSWAF